MKILEDEAWKVSCLFEIEQCSKSLSLTLIWIFRSPLTFLERSEVIFCFFFRNKTSTMVVCLRNTI